VPVT